MSEERHTELMGLQTELSSAALKAAMERDAPPRAPADARRQTLVQRALHLSPLVWIGVSFLAGTVAGSLLRPVVVRGRRDER